MREQQLLPNIMPENCQLFIQAAPAGYVYEFGVHVGKTMCKWMEMSNLYNPRIEGFLGFDSFEGLPAEHPKISLLNPDWGVGEFDSRKEFNVSSPKEVCEVLDKKFAEYGRKCELIVGFYENSLTDDLAKKFEYEGKLAGFVHIDTDIYVSAKQCLDWLFKHDLVLTNAIFRFDDLLDTVMWVNGESLALKEVTETYGLIWERYGLNIFIYRGRNDS